MDIYYQMLPRYLISWGIKTKEIIKVLPYITKYITVKSEEERNTPNRLKLVVEFLTNQTEVRRLMLFFGHITLEGFLNDVCLAGKCACDGCTLLY